MDGIPADILARTGDAASQASAVKASLAKDVAASGDKERAAKMFEELLATLLVREMRRGLEGGFFGTGAGSDVYEGWLDEHVGRSLSDSHALDLAQSIRVSLGAKERVNTNVENER